jgi:tRNA threonylcarbamoyl adenosine modification protein (Sua5/YciO/YrdC/YwlC family)
LIWHVHPQNPEKRILGWIVEALVDGEILILPTDTVYAFACASDSPRAIEQVYALKNLPENKPLSLLCTDLAMASKYAQGISNSVFRFMKAATPGPFTFVFRANRNMDRRATGKRKEVGIRIVDHVLIQSIVEQLGVPLLSTSVPSTEHFIDPEALDEEYGKRIHAVVDGGVSENLGSTILDCKDGEIEVVRKSAGAEILARLGLEEFVSQEN